MTEEYRFCPYCGLIEREGLMLQHQQEEHPGKPLRSWISPPQRPELDT